jgi:actin-related protein 2
MEEGVVKDWDNMMKVWHYCFSKVLKQPSSDTKLLLTEAALNSRENRARMGQAMFESFGFKEIRIDVQAVLTLYGMGHQTGMVVDSGDGVTHCIPVFEGLVLPNTIRRMNIAGRHLTDYLIKLLLMRGYSFSTSSDFEVVREIKEKLCYVAHDLGKDRKLANETTVLEEDYKLPDGKYVKIGRERFEAAEALFHPILAGRDEEGLSDMLWKSIMSSSMDIRATLFGGIVLSGGSTMFPGISDRIKKDLRTTHRQVTGGAKSVNVKFNVEDPPYRKHLVYLGGATLARIVNDDSSYWISKKAYEEQGDRVFN